MTKRTEIEASKLYEKYIEEKHELMNHSKIIEYLFNKPSPKIIKNKDLITDYDSTIKIVRLEETDKNSIVFNFDTMNGFFDRYIDLCKKSEYATKMNLLPQRGITTNFVSNSNHKTIGQIKTLSKETELINKILYKCEKPFKMSYISNWTFQIEGEHISLSKKPTVNIEEKYIFDFFGLTMVHGQLVLFVIEYDDDFKFKNYTNEHHVNDIFQQYILFQLNINLLRLNKNSDFKKEIVRFLKLIRNTRQYVIENPIEPISKAFSTLPALVMKEKMDQFMADYKYNYLIYLKYPGKKNQIYGIDDDKYFDKINNEILKKSNEDISIVSEDIQVNDDIIEKILKKKENYHARGEADKIIVELLGNDINYRASIVTNDALQCISKLKDGSNKNPIKYVCDNDVDSDNEESSVQFIKDTNTKKNTNSVNILKPKRIIICDEARECISKLKNGTNKNPTNYNDNVKKNVMKSVKADNISVELIDAKNKY